MAHPQNSPRGLFAKARISLGNSTGTLSYNTTGTILGGALYLSGRTQTKLTANTTGIIASGALFASGQTTGGKLTANSTGVIAGGALYVSGQTASKISANSTTTTVANAFAVSGQATVGKIAANSTAILLPATGIQMAALTSLKITSNSTGIKISTKYISCNSTGNATT